MSPIDNNLNTNTGLGPIAGAPRATAPVGPIAAAPTLGTDTANAGLEVMSRQIAASYRNLQTALLERDDRSAQACLDQLTTLTNAAVQMSAGTPYAASYQRVQNAIALTKVQYEAAQAQQTTAPVPAKPTTPAAGGKQTAPAPRTEDKPKKSGHHGLFGFVGNLVDKAGSVLNTAGHIVFAPLELAGKVLDPVRHAIGGVLGGLRKTIDNTLGRIPIIGSAVRFTTGLANSVVGLVNGAIEGVTHPMELLKGLGSMAWTLAGLVPPFINARTLYEMGVNGKNPIEAQKEVLGEGGNLLKGFFGNALQDIKEGNYAGALGQVTGDIGSFFVGGAGAVGAAGKVAATGSELAKVSEVAKAAEVGELAGKASMVSRVAKVADAAKATEIGGRVAKAVDAAKATELGGKVVDAANAVDFSGKAAKVVNAYGKAIDFGVNTSGRIFTLGLKGNFAAWNKVGKAVSGLPGMQRVTQLTEDLRANLLARRAARNAAAKADGTAAKAPPAADPVGGAAPLQSSAAGVQRVDEMTSNVKPLDVKMYSQSHGQVENWQVVGQTPDGKFRVMRADGGVKNVTYKDLMAYNPELRPVDLWAATDKLENKGALSGLRGWTATDRGPAANIPGSNGGLWKDGRVFGRTPDGNILAERPNVYDASGHLVQPEGANVIKLDKFLAANPDLVRGQYLGKMDGHMLYVGDVIPGSNDFRIRFPDGKGNWYNAGKLSSTQLADKLRMGGALDHLPEGKLGIDGMAHTLDDPTLGIGNGGIVDRAKADQIQQWFLEDRQRQYQAFNTIGNDPRAVNALKNWNGLTEAQKAQMGQYVAYQQGLAYGFKPVPIEIVQSFPGNPNQYGVFLPDRGVLQVRADQLANPSNFLNTVFHEQLHAYQWENVQKLRNGQMAVTDPLYNITKEWSDNWYGYRTGQGTGGYTDYFSQPLEAHAFNGGNAFEQYVNQLVASPQGNVQQRVAAAVGR